MKLPGMQGKRSVEKLQRLLSSSLLALLAAGALFQGSAALANETGMTRFGQWCDRKETLTTEARHTVEVLLEVAETQDCDRADTVLSQRTELQQHGRTKRVDATENPYALYGLTTRRDSALDYTCRIVEFETDPAPAESH